MTTEGLGKQAQESASEGPLVLAADLGGTKLALGLVALGGKLLRQWRVDTPAAEGGEAVVGALLALVAQAQAEIGPAQREALVGLGLAAAGAIDPLEGRVVAANDNLPGWAGMPLKARLREGGWALALAVENDADAAALAEARHGAGRGASSVVMLTVGTGVGGGLVLGDRLHRGASHRAMEVGAMIVDRQGPAAPDPSGRRGALEGLAAGPAYGRAGAPLGLDAKSLFAAADAGDAAAEAALEGPILALAAAVASLAATLDPACVVLGGGVAEQPGLLPRLRAALARPELAGHLPYPPERVVGAGLGQLAGLLGAAEAAFATAGLAPAL